MSLKQSTGLFFILIGQIFSVVAFAGIKGQMDIEVRNYDPADGYVEGYLSWHNLKDTVTGESFALGNQNIRVPVSDYCTETILLAREIGFPLTISGIVKEYKQGLSEESPFQIEFHDYIECSGPIASKAPQLQGRWKSNCMLQVQTSPIIRVWSEVRVMELAEKNTALYLEKRLYQSGYCAGEPDTEKYKFKVNLAPSELPGLWNLDVPEVGFYTQIVLDKKNQLYWAVNEYESNESCPKISTNSTIRRACHFTQTRSYYYQK